MSAAFLLLLAALQDRAPVPGGAEFAAARAAVPAPAATPVELNLQARRLIEEALAPDLTPAARYALLAEARDRAAAGGDVAAALLAVERIAERFAVDPVAVRLEAIDRLRPAARSPAASAFLAEACVRLAGDVAADPDRALAVLERADGPARDSLDEALSTRLRERIAELRGERDERRRIAAAEERLRAAPDDPDANTAVGLFRCFRRSQWPEGLAALAKGADAPLAALARAELAAPADAAARLALGEGWWMESARFDGRLKAGLQARAFHWFEQAAAAAGDLSPELRSRLEQAYAAAAGLGGGAVRAGNVAFGAGVRGAERGELLVDGVTTGYDGGNGYTYGSWPCEWIVEFPRPLLLRQVRLLLWDGDERFYRYAVETSPDGTQFGPLVDRGSGEWRSWQVLNFAPRPVRALRIRGLFNSANTGFHAVELEAYCLPPAGR
jgi:hypothetical protein